ncbi:dopamine beta-hydroxylase-like isoform X2 [Mytilus trossulus]|uniref:dopamine beta-hydroxylase-like isoform X2 n=1 Tax=Mytilus trossulus TaxID=6551 RepID=UPI00300742A2
MKTELKYIVICACLMTLFDGSCSYPSYQSFIPNGDKVPHPCHQNKLWNGVGHELPGGGGALNPFGIDLYQNKVNTGKIWTKSICEADSDGDGRTNGQELGDPDCMWTENTSQLFTNSTITHPGICEPTDSENCRKKNKWLKCDDNNFHCPAIQEDPDVKELTLKIPKTKVQHKGSRYVCTHLHVPLDGDYHVIAVKPHVDNRRVVHHILLFGCDAVENQPRVNEARTCDSTEGPSYCRLVTFWGIGVNGECFPDQFGIPIGNHGFTRFMLQIHWQNSENDIVQTDSSGMTLYYTPALRLYNAAVLTVGQSMFHLGPGQSEVKVEGNCTGRCTKREFKGPIYIHSSANHMHTLGRKQRVELYRNGSLINIISDQDHFSFHRQHIKKHNSPIEIQPGDDLRVTCTYDTTSRNETTSFGEGTEHEMCFAFLTFYPIENVHSNFMCYQWLKFPHCLIRDVENLWGNVKKNLLLKIGIKAAMNSLLNQYTNKKLINSVLDP